MEQEKMILDVCCGSKIFWFNKHHKNTIYMDSSIASVAQLSQVGKDVAVTIKTPSALDTNDVKVFSLKKDTVNQKPYRIVVDVQKKGVAPKPINYGKKPSPATAPASSKGSGIYSVSGGLSGKVITIDPGHGGSDSGAVGPNGYTEKEGTFAISQKVASILNQSGAKVVMTRDSDVDVYGPNASARNELQARVDVGNNANSDIFVSIHCNAFVNPAANGTQTFYYGSSYQGQRLAQSIQEKMIEANGLRDRGISTCNFYVVKHSYMPAVLIETAFITNYDEEALLSDDEWQTTMAKAIAEGINEYFSN